MSLTSRLFDLSKFLCLIEVGKNNCCDMRQVQIRNKAAASEIIPEVSIRRMKLIYNQRNLLVLYMASLIPFKNNDQSSQGLRSLADSAWGASISAMRRIYQAVVIPSYDPYE